MDGPLLDRNLGRLHQGTARCEIGPIPVSYDETDAPSFEAVNGNITAFVAPGLSLKYKLDGNYKAYVHIPITEDNEYYDKLLTITMICDDRMENYWNLHRYMQTIQSGATDAFPAQNLKHRVYGQDGFYRNRRTYIPYINIHMADDSYQKHQIVKFERCFPLELEQLSMNFMGQDPVKFTVSFVYSKLTVERQAPPNEIDPVNCIAE